MSELKAFVARKIDDGTCDPVPCIEVYPKSEADKVIAEKDKEIQRLESLCESYRIDCDNFAIREANAYKAIERDNKQIRHQKYKRCLAMAKWCENAILGWMGHKESFSSHQRYIKVMLFTKWQERWLKIAEQFKEAK